MGINLEVLQNGLVVLSVGVFVVFTFLVVLICSMTIMGKVIAWLNKIFPVAAPQAAPVKVAASADEEIAVAIACALMKQNH